MSKLPVGSVAFNVSAVRLNSINVGLQSTCAIQLKKLSLQTKACFSNDMPAHLKQLFEGPLRFVMMNLNDLGSRIF